MNISRIVMVGFAFVAVPAVAGETDQYLVWQTELEDSADALNGYLNETVNAFLAEHPRKNESREEVVRDIYFHLFNGLLSSRVRHWLQESPEVDRFPPASVSWWTYQTESIYNRRSFPYILPLSRTIRVGDIYCGIDKFGHFFGFGRRFFNHYLALRSDGMSDRDAREAVILRGVAWENLTVGKLVDGIFSHADIEAGYQGMELALVMADESEGYLVADETGWRLARPIDIRPYVNPDFDESYNPCHYWALRKRFVLPTLRDRYRHATQLASVQARFDRYDAYEPSFCRQVLARHFDGAGENPQRAQFREAFGLPVRMQELAQNRSHQRPTSQK